ncbi:MAG: sodium:calcium antiporter [Gammaproteobacteria bacterium]
MNPATWTLLNLIAAFVAAAAVIGWFGVRMTQTARDLAYDTGMGEALMGALFIGASTSLSGITTSVASAFDGYAELSFSNALGGIAAQTTFLAIADIVYRRANLEHAAASAENLFMTALLLTLLVIHVMAVAVPDVAIWGIHPASLVLVGVYVFGINLLARTHDMPMWLPRRTEDTSRERVKHNRIRHKRLSALWFRFAMYSAVVATCGWVLAEVAIPLGERTGISQGIVGGIFTAVSTSIPELVVAITAVRMGSLNLAVGDIVGGNAFDTLFVAASDIAYRSGPIYAAISAKEIFWLANATLMTCILLMGLIYRERRGPANIGLESVTLLLLYFGGISVLGGVL